MTSVTRAVVGCVVLAALSVSSHGLGLACAWSRRGEREERAPTPQSLDGIASRLEEIIPRLLERGTVPGLSVAVIWNGELGWQRGFGLANASTRAPVASDSVFEAASLSKPVFAYAVLKLVDAGQLDLDRPLVDYLPGRDDVGNDPRLDRLTARHVLSHTSGFPNWRPKKGGPLPMYFSPGERFSYSGEGFVFLGKVIEHVTGEPLEAFMKREVFGPLGMTSSSYVWQDPYVTRRASNHDAAGVPLPSWRPTTPNVAASLLTTSSDYARFAAAVLNGVGLKRETATAMISTWSHVDEAGPFAVPNPSGGHVARDLSWGLGWGLEVTRDGPAFWHWGANDGNRAFVIVCETTRRGVVIFTDSQEGLSVVPEIVETVVGGEHAAFAWLGVKT